MIKRTNLLKKLLLCSAFTLTFSLLCSCGSRDIDSLTTREHDEISENNSEKSESDSSDNDVTDTLEDSSNISDNLNSLLGEWKLVAICDSDTFRLPEKEYEKSSLNFYEDNNEIKADYSFSYYDYEKSVYLNIPLIEQNESFGELTQSNWHAKFDLENKVENTYSVTLESPDLLLLQIHYDYSDISDRESDSDFMDAINDTNDSEDIQTNEDTASQNNEKNSGDSETDNNDAENNSNENVDISEDQDCCMGSPDIPSYDQVYVYVPQDIEDYSGILNPYRYPNTVTVSNVKELYDAIDSRTRIILKKGKYNISDLTGSDRNRAELNSYYYDGEAFTSDEESLLVSNLDNILLEAEENSDVTITTNDAYASPLSFYNCNYVSLKGLTVGHDVEPGYCSGAVLQLDCSSNVSIDNCNLFGSGTYGIYSTYSYDIDVSNTDIYDCSYGLLWLTNTTNANFNNCTFRDSKEFTMLDLIDSSNIYFNKCKFDNNSVDDDNYSSFINSSEYSEIIFKNCIFTNNHYKTFATFQPEMINCSIKDNN